MKGTGFTLVEVLVALVILEVGLLGVVGTLWLAASTLARAERTERGASVLERVYDSLAMEESPTSGEVVTSAGTARWRVGGGVLRMEWSSGPDSALVRLEGRVGRTWAP